VSPSIQKALNAAAGCRAQFAIKVALIASPADLGALPSLFGKPQKYADYLEEEIRFGGMQPLLVVMASGYGTVGLNPPARRAVTSLHKPESGRSETSLVRQRVPSSDLQPQTATPSRTLPASRARTEKASTTTQT
jgi:hypothetical protein